MDNSKFQGFRAVSPLKTVRLIDENGAAVGIVSFREAQDLAHQKDMDLIEISAEADPPVYKIGDYGRLRYKEQKKKHEMMKKSKSVVIKEIQLRSGIHQHDYQIKVAKAIQFLKEKHKIKLVMQFRGREIQFSQAGLQIVTKFLAELSVWGKVENQPKLEGKKIVCVVSPLAVPLNLAGSQEDEIVESSSLEVKEILEIVKKD